MATGKKWEKEIEKLSFTEKQKIRDALNELEAWRFFNQEYGWTGYKAVRSMVQSSIDAEVNRFIVLVPKQTRQRRSRKESV